MTVVDVPVPVVVVPPGFRVSVQVPVEGRPLSTTLPVATVQVGWVMVPTTGAVGLAGGVLMTTFPDVTETQLKELVTVKVQVPADSPVMVVEVPVPVEVVPPGLRVSVQVPEAGRPLRTTLPVATAQVG